MTGVIVLGYAGCGDVAPAVSWLNEVYGLDVVTLTLDLGQGRNLGEVRDRALAAGAVRAHVLDVREEFIREFVLPMLRAGVSQQGPVPPAVALGQALVAQKLVEVAAIEGASAIAHGSGAQDEERFNATLAALDVAVTTITLPSAVMSSDDAHVNVWGSVGVATRTPATALDTPAAVDIAIDRGMPTAVNGVPMALVELIESLSTIGGRHRVGRAVMHDGRVYDAPAAAILHAAYRALETAVVPPELIRIQREQAVRYAQLVYSCRWFSPSRVALDTSSGSVRQMVTGTVRVKLFDGELLSSFLLEPGPAVVSQS